MITMREIESSVKLENVNNGEQVVLTLTVSEIIERPLYFRIIAIIDVIGNEPNYIAVDVFKSGTLSDVDWIRFRHLSPLDGIKIVAKKVDSNISRCILTSFIIIHKMETPHYVQYCSKCDQFTFISGIDKSIQCHADDPKHPADVQISKVPMKLRANNRLYYQTDPILYPIRPIGLYEEFLPDQVHQEYNSAYNCPACGKYHDTYLLTSRRTGIVFMYCPVINYIIQITNKDELK